jgi:hypothetical protein
MKLTDLSTAVEVLVEAIKTDYREYTLRGKSEYSEVNTSMIADFENKIKVTDGKKYIKVITGNSVWGFIVKNTEGKFRAGDILMAAGWSAPARNKARGNVFDGYTIQWTGPLYLK